MKNYKDSKFTIHFSSDAVGTGQGDNCHILDPNEFAKETLLLSYVLPEEKVYVLLKSPREEYIFTDRAFISVKGDSSIGTKKVVQRFEFNEHRVASVRLQTPGYSGTDFDGELYFRLGGYEISIDIRKPEWENVKTIYKTLIRLAEKQTRDAASLKFFQDTIAKAWLQTADGKALKELAFSASAEAYDRFLPISYRDIWELHGK